MKKEKMLKKVALFTCVLTIAFESAQALAMKSILVKNDNPAPVFEVATVFESGANNPNETTRFEGVPNLLKGSTGYCSYYSLGGGNYCTLLKSGSVNPWVGYTGNIFSEGIYIVEMDISKKGLSRVIFRIMGSNSEGSTALITPFWFEKDGIITLDESVSAYTNKENYDKLKNYIQKDVPDKESWYNIRAEFDLGTKTYDIYLNKLLIIENAKPAESLGTITGVNGWRITQTNTSGTETDALYIDNYYVGINTIYNKELLKNAVIMWSWTSDAIVRRIPTLVDRYDLSVVPLKKDEIDYLPLRFIADCCRADISYDDTTQTATIIYNGRTYNIKSGSQILVADGAETICSAVPITVGGRILIPAETAANIFNKNIYYQSDKIMLTDYSGVIESDFETIFETWEAKL